MPVSWRVPLCCRTVTCGWPAATPGRHLCATGRGRGCQPPELSLLPVTTQLWLPVEIKGEGFVTIFNVKPPPLDRNRKCRIARYATCSSLSIVDYFFCASSCFCFNKTEAASPLRTADAHEYRRCGKPSWWWLKDPDVPAALADPKVAFIWGDHSIWTFFLLQKAEVSVSRILAAAAMNLK